MSKATKKAMIDSIRNRIGDNKNFLVADTSKMDAITANKWRITLREKDIEVFSVKNTLARVALHEVGVTALDPYLEGPSTLIWGGTDVVALSKEITKWARDMEEKLQVKGAAIEGSSLDTKGVTALSKSPGRAELLSILAGQILSPGANLAGALLGPGGLLASQIKTLTEEKTDGEVKPEETPAG